MEPASTQPPAPTPPTTLQRYLSAARSFTLWLLRAIPRALIDFREHGLRISYLILPLLILAAIIVNIFIPKGWTAWPFVFAAASFMYVHEAADRNGQGIPPGQVYLLFAGALALWLTVATILSVISPLIVLAGVGFLVYYALQAYMKDRAKRKVIEQRRADGRCIFCGEIADIQQGICMNCGEEPDPTAMQLARIQAIVKNRGGAANARTREILKQDSLAAAARKKEAKLIQKSPRRNMRKPK